MSEQSIKVQSVSDIITNSSSEVFCRIESDNSLELIKEILRPLFAPGDWDDCSPFLTEVDLDDEEYEEWCEDWETRIPRKWIEINMPYGLSNATEFYKAGLEAILSDRVPDDYRIIYDEY